MKIWRRYRDVVRANWHFGFTAFGGPPVQFQTVSWISVHFPLMSDTDSFLQFHKKFVEDLCWIDEHTVSG